MIIFGISIRHLGPNLRVMLVPFFLIIIFINLTYVLITEGYSKVNLQNANNIKVENNVRTLENKVEILQEIDKSIIDKTDDSLLTLPTENPSSIFVNQFKSLATQNNIVITKISNKIDTKSNKSDKEMANVLIEFQSEDIGALLQIAQSLKTYTPISNISEFSFINDSKLKMYSAKIEANVYWAELPDKISKISESIDRLSPAENQTIDWIVSLNKPQLTTLNPEAPTGRENPFQ